jgi:deazaflavin-dependent oxidoreductase (nitroreductase family)
MPEPELKQALSDAREVELTVTGRKSGQPSTRPVWFTEDGEKVFLMPVGGSGANWFKNVLQTPTIHLAAGGAEADVEATPITDASRVSEIMGRFSEKYGASSVTDYYPDQDAAVEVPLA